MKNTIADPQLQVIVDQLRQELAVDVCSLYIAQKDDHLLLSASSGLDQKALGARLHITQGLTGKVARSRRSLSVKNPDSHPDYHHVAASGEEKYRSYLGIPLVRRQTLYGVLVVQTIKPKMFFMGEIQTLFAAGRRLMEQLEQDGYLLP